MRLHPFVVGVVALVMIVAIFFLDATVHPVTMAGFYLIPLTLLAGGLMATSVMLRRRRPAPTSLRA